MSTIVVRLPYISENPLNISTYTENIPGYDHPSNSRKYRPWQLLAQLVLPVWQEFINQKAEDHQYNGGDDGSIAINLSARFLRIGTCAAMNIFSVLPNTDSTSRNMITSMNITV